MNLFIRSLVVLVAWLGLSAVADDRPHIVLIVADDMGYADAGFMGAKDVQTPVLDGLAKRGVVLGAHYVQPVCSPTRAALMTGRYAIRTGVYTIVRPGAKWGLPLTERTLAQTLHDAGYETAICGKWHLGEFEPAYLPTHRGFDHQYGHWFGAIDYFTHVRGQVDDWHRDDQPLHESGYSTELVAAEACRLIEQRNKQKPFFLYLPFNAVHGPLQVPEHYTKLFDALSGPRRTYAGMLAAMDQAIGQVRDMLAKQGMLSNTLIVFTSDNGGPSPGKVTNNGPLRAGKGTIFEGGVRGCAFATWPGHIDEGRRSDEPVHAVDWFPTILHAAGVTATPANPLDGLDIMSVLKDGARSPHASILLVGNPPTRAAVRVGNWKLLQNASETDDEDTDRVPAGKRRHGTAAKDTFELYNLADDLGEKKNVASENPDKVKELKDVLATYLNEAVPSGAAAQ